MTRKIQFQVPFFMMESLRVAQATALHVWRTLAYVGGSVEVCDGDIATPAPMTVKAKTTYPAEPVEEKAAYGKAEVFFHFGGGLSVKVWLTSWTSTFGEHWAVTKVEAKYYVCREGHGRDDKKTVTYWEDGELDQLAKCWGNNPRRWRE